jgi:hypothetical protein
MAHGGRLRDQEDNEYQHKGACDDDDHYYPKGIGIVLRNPNPRYVTFVDADDRLFLFSVLLEDPHQEMFARDQVGVFCFFFLGGRVFSCSPLIVY